MGRLTLVTGGARSGKSRHAESMAAGRRVAYVATLEVKDSEMAARVRAHRRRRPPAWKTIERPREILPLLSELAGKCDVAIVDCLTLYLTNLLLDAGRKAKIEKLVGEIEDIAEAAKAAPFDVIVVTNEVGGGIVPDSELGRIFRDASGLANQVVARSADEVLLMVCGIPIKVK